MVWHYDADRRSVHEQLVSSVPADDRMHRAVTCTPRWTLPWLIVLVSVSCGHDESRDTPYPRRVERARQAKFSPTDFAFVKLQVSDGEADGLFGTCLHIPMRDAKEKMHDCDLGITLPIYVRGEKWPRDENDAAKYAAKEANAVRKNLLKFTHADAFTCRAFWKPDESVSGTAPTQGQTTMARSGCHEM